MERAVVTQNECKMTTLLHSSLRGSVVIPRVWSQHSPPVYSTFAFAVLFVKQCVDYIRECVV